MGCFSYMCKKCGKGILSNSFSGEEVHLFLLVDGIVCQRMTGPYDSYGRVFNEDGSRQEWMMPWHEVVGLHFGDDKSCGIAAIHAKCWDGTYPKERSEDDPNQGWGEDGELFFDMDPSREY